MIEDIKNILRNSGLLSHNCDYNNITFPKVIKAEEIIKKNYDALPEVIKNWKFKEKQIFRIKKGAPVWLISLQSNITFNEDATYIQICAWSCQKDVVFGYKIEKNLFGPLKYDYDGHNQIEVCTKDLDFDETYTEENFCNDRFFWMDYVYTGESSKTAGAEHTPD